MDRRALVAEVAAKTDYAKWEINAMMEPLLDTILEALQNGEEVHLKKFGTFSLKYHKEKETLHPKTRKRVNVPAKASVTFKSTRMFKPTEQIMERLAKEKSAK